ncbi:MAG: cyclophane-forming radical SAM/SPASM peptide maturase YhhB [Saprospiraceae bacterium]
MVDKNITDFDIQPDLDTVLIKVASRCNINCSYCYVYHMGDDNWSQMEKLISLETMDAVCNSLKELSQSQNKCFSIVLHGGEPLLLGAFKLDYFLCILRNALPESYPISIQTNGILITREILDICSKYKASIAVSIDGPKFVHDKSRVTHKGEGTFEEVIKGIHELESHADSIFLYSGLLAVIDPQSDPVDVYSFFKELAPPSIDFLYRDGNHTNLPAGKSSVNSTEYGVWMAGLLDAYLDDETPIPIRVLDDMLKVLLGGIVSKEGLGLTDFGIIIIDTDGTITKNDTLKSSYNRADRFESKLNIKDGNLLNFLTTDEFQLYREMQRPTSLKCIKCPMLNVCGGGMTLHRWRKENGFNNPSVFCADQLFLIDRMQEKLVQFGVTHE